MPTTNDPQHFVDQAKQNGLVISVTDAEDLDGFLPAVDGAYAAIREIDTAGFEPAAIFVPTPSKKEAD
ncbi:MAG: hypothetical protein HOJ22_09545 [Chloroflexi bacterium]|nr:hypothetical protein [Chloroflexota bacterium]MBT5628524.1 hypothetical protein [Chloroflexota bacterium]